MTCILAPLQSVAKTNWEPLIGSKIEVLALTATLILEFGTAKQGQLQWFNMSCILDARMLAVPDSLIRNGQGCIRANSNQWHALDDWKHAVVCSVQVWKFESDATLGDALDSRLGLGPFPGEGCAMNGHEGMCGPGAKTGCI